MAITKIADVIVPELFNRYVINRTMELSAFFQSGIVVNSPEFDALASEAARTHNMPFFEDLQGESEAILEDVKMTAKKIGSNKDVSTTIYRQNMWGASNLSAALAGADPMKAIGDLVASYWARDMQKELISILAGVFGGMFFIKLGTKKGWTKYISDFSYLSGELKTGLVPKEKRTELGKATTSSVVLDPLAWHFAILMVAAGAGRLLYKFFYDKFNFDGPSYLYSFLVGLLLFYIFKKTHVNYYIDNNVTNRITGTCTDYLVFFGIASINLGIIVKYAMPLAMLLLFGIFIVVITLMYFGPAMNKGSWFERALFVFGYSTGVFAIGFILLRIVDPENKSLTLNDTAFACIFTTFSELFTWSFGPMMLLNGQHWLFIGIQVAIMAVCIIINLVMKWWWIKEPLDRPAVGVDGY